MSYRESDAEAAAQAKKDQDALAAEEDAFKKALHRPGSGDPLSRATWSRGIRALRRHALLIFPVLGLVVGWMGSPANRGVDWGKPFVGAIMGAVLGGIAAAVFAAVGAITRSTASRGGR
jgi:hypothetical protein